MESREKVLVVDFGGQYTHLIARRCRELEVYSEVVPFERAVEEVESSKEVKALIFSGGPRSVYEENAPKVERSVIESGLPVLGICYGHQLIGKLLGGEVKRAPLAEYGRTKVRTVGDSNLFSSLPKEFNVWMSHGDVVLSPPPGFSVTAITETGLIAAMENYEKSIYTVQFHPEVRHTEHGMKVLENFLREIAGLKERWRAVDRIGQMLNEIRERVGEGGKVVCGVSGGVDSMVTALLVHKAIGDRLYVVFVDHGLLRKGEADEVKESLKRLGVKNVIAIDAADRFLEALRVIKDPEEKRKIIGRLFVEVFESITSNLEGVTHLAQGTIYPDRVESGATSGTTSVIKSHHNVGGLPNFMKLKLLEPLRDLYKDEVRKVALELGLPEKIVTRHPFPGPGLAVRIIGEVTKEKLEICREANAIVEEEIRKAGLYEKLWQAFAVVTDSKWVGVKGDAREEGYIVVIRAVTSDDGMTADSYPLPFEVLYQISRRITNEVKGVTMVAYALSPKPPSTIEAC